jgi:1-acyl-sn-glycerol-3-phosphate acyltransferase
MPPDEVVLAPPHTVPKTSSGKIRRAACREIYEQGNRGTTSRSVVWQSIRLMGRGALPALRKAGRLIGDWCFAFYGLLLALLTALLICPIVLLLPRRSMRWRLLAQTGKLLALVTATPLSVQGLKNLPDKSEKAVLVANHSSYLDGLVLIATLPLQCRFAAKAELNKVPLIGHFLARLGVEFVERFDREKSVSDAAHLVDLCRKGEPLMVFPEGTFRRETGLLSFRMGAFQAAADAGVPVVPITIVGTRAKLRAETWMGRRGPVRVVIAPPIAPAGEGWSAALALRDAARQAILERCEEPDLAT